MAYNSFINKQVGTQSPTFKFQKDRANATIVSGDGLGQFQFYGFDGTSYLLTSAITSTSSGTIAANRIGSNLEFYTHPDSVTASTQRMVIESTGQLQINDPSSNVASLFVTNNQSTPNINLRTANATASNAPHMHFTRSRAGTADVAASDDLGRFEYYGFQGGTARQAAQVSAVAQTVNGTNAVSGYLSFSTVPTTYAAMAERVRIAADGNVTVNSPVSGVALTVDQTTGSSAIGTSQTFGGAASIQSIQTSNDVQPVYYNVYKRRTGGTVSNGDIIHQINSLAQNAGVDYQATLTRSVATTVGAGFVAGSLDWWTTSSTGSTNQRMSLDQDGRVVINTPAATGTALTVNGFNAAGTYTAQFLSVVPGNLADGIRVLNNTTTAGSSCQIECAVSSQALTTGGDAYMRFVNYGLNAVSLGWSASDQKFAMASGSGIAANRFFTYTQSNAQINLPFQASFNAYSGADQLNVTGAGATYQVLFNTERFDVANGYSTATSTYTAPASGKYMFSTQVRVDSLSAAMNQGFIVFQVNGGTYSNNDFKNPFAAGYSGGLVTFQGTTTANLAAGDTVKIFLIISGGAGNTASILTTVDTYFCGQLLS